MYLGKEMPIIHKATQVPYNAIQMYDLVNDVELYHQFVPHCTGSKVLSRSEDEVRATLSFSGAGFEKSFTTLNRLQPHKMVEVRLVDGPFSHLEGFWRFDALDDAQCNVVLDMEFEFSSRLLGMVFGPLFHQVTLMLVDAFHQRAREVYS